MDHQRLCQIVRRPEFAALFTHFLKKLDRQGFDQRSKRLYQRAERSPLTDLASPGEPGADERCWMWVRSLRDAGLLDVHYARRPKASAPPWEHAELIFPPEAEERIREWLGHPVPTSEAEAWSEAVDAYAERLPDPAAAKGSPLIIPGMSPESVVERLLQIPHKVRCRQRTARQLSAALFGGDSKRLDGREEWLRAVFGLTEDELPHRALLVEVSMPPNGQPNGYLLVENLDSYLEALDGFWPETEGLALIYVSGFRASAARVRARSYVRFHFYEGAPATASAELANRWCDPSANLEPMFFCGDLDHEGLRIFVALNRIFPELQPWRPGYERMLSVLRDGEGHTPEQAGKSGQRAVEATGNRWFDVEVLPELRERNAFVDQEVIGARD